MVYNVKKVIKNNISDEEFINICNKRFHKTVIIASIFIAIVIFLFFGLIGCNYIEKEVLFPKYYNVIVMTSKLLDVLLCIFCFPGLISIKILFGNVSSNGIIAELNCCKEIKDWVDFSEWFGFDIATVRFSKRLEIENKNIIEVVLNSMEVRCKDLRTGNIEVMRLWNDESTFQKVFRIEQDNSLAENEMIIDLSGEEPIAYIKS